MMRFTFHKNRREQGSIIIIALVLLVLVTLMGISITQITSIELQLAGNERDYKIVFYEADAAVMEALQRLDSAPAEDLNPSATTFTWLYRPFDPADSSTKNLDIKTTWADPNVGSNSNIDPGTTRYAATALGITPGSSLSLTTSSRLYSFDAYGYAKERGQALILGGFRRRF